MQESQYVVYYHLFVDSAYISEVYKIGDLERTKDTIEIVTAPVNRSMWKRNLDTNIKLAPSIELEMYKRKDLPQQLVIYDWEQKKEMRTCKLIETDAGADPLDTSHYVNTWDLGRCQISSITDMGSDRTSPTAGIVKFTILTSYIIPLIGSPS